MVLCLWDTNAEVDVNIGEMLIKEGLAARPVASTATRFHDSGDKEASHHHKNEGSLYHDDYMKGPVDLLDSHVASYIDQAIAQVKDESHPGTPSWNQSLQNVQSTNCSVNDLPDMHWSTETLNTVNSDLDSKVVHMFRELFLATIREMKQHLPGIFDVSESASCKANENDCAGRQAVSASRFSPQSPSTNQATVASGAHSHSMHEGSRAEEPIICVTSLDKEKDVIFYSDR